MQRAGCPMPAQIAADGGVDPTLAGAAVACAVAGIGYFGTRKSRTDSAQTLIDSAVALGHAAAESETQARAELRELRAEFDAYRERTDAALAACLDERRIILEVARQAGVDLSGWDAR